MLLTLSLSYPASKEKQLPHIHMSVLYMQKPFQTILTDCNKNLLAQTTSPSLAYF